MTKEKNIESQIKEDASPKKEIKKEKYNRDKALGKEDLRDHNFINYRPVIEKKVLPVLMQGLSQLATNRPKNSLEFLGNYLLFHSGLVLDDKKNDNSNSNIINTKDNKDNKDLKDIKNKKKILKIKLERRKQTIKI